MFLVGVASGAQAHEVNFQQLENCFSWTNLGLRSSEMNGFRNSTFLGSPQHGTNASVDLNALVTYLDNPSRVAVIQQNGGTMYNLSSPNMLRSACSRNQDRGGVVLPVSGFLNANENSENIDTNIRVQVREVPGASNELCPINSASARMTPTGLRGQEMSDQQIEATVRQAVLQRMTWLESNVTPENTRMLQRNFGSALNNGGACFQVLPMFPGLDEARSRVLCKMQASPGPECQTASTAPDSDGADTEARP